MEKRHVDHGSEWAEDEELFVYNGYLDNVPFQTLVDTFPTDRNPKSIRMKLRNHEWEHTNGKRGLSGGNNWVKTKWSRLRIAMVCVDERELTRLRERREELYTELAAVRAREKEIHRELDSTTDAIKRRETKQQDTVRLPN